MSISEKIKTINNKIEKNKGRYNSDRPTANISALQPGKQNIWLLKNFLNEKDLLEKFAVIKKFEYSLLSKELKKQTSAAEKLYQKLDDTHEFDAIIKK